MKDKIIIFTTIFVIIVMTLCGCTNSKSTSSNIPAEQTVTSSQNSDNSHSEIDDNKKTSESITNGDAQDTTEDAQVDFFDLE